MELQRVGHDWATELNRTELISLYMCPNPLAIQHLKWALILNGLWVIIYIAGTLLYMGDNKINIYGICYQSVYIQKLASTNLGDDVDLSLWKYIF